MTNHRVEKRTFTTNVKHVKFKKKKKQKQYALNTKTPEIKSHENCRVHIIMSFQLGERERERILYLYIYHNEWTMPEQSEHYRIGSK